MKRIFIDVVEAIGGNVKSEINAKIKELHKKAILPGKVLQPLSEYNEDDMIEVNGEDCKLVLEPRVNREFGFRQAHYSQFVEKPFDFFMNNLAENNLLVFHNTCREKYQFLCKYEDYILSKNILLINRELPQLRTHFMNGSRIDETNLAKMKRDAENRINNSINQLLVSPEQLSNAKDNADNLTVYEAYNKVEEKRKAVEQLVNDQKKYEAKCKSFGMNFLISILVLIALAVAAFGVYMYNTTTIIPLVIGGVGVLCWLGFMVALLVNHNAYKHKNADALDKINKYNSRPELYKYKTFNELKEYTRSSLMAYLENVVVYILREQVNPVKGYDNDLIHKILVEYEKTDDFNEIIKKYIKVQLFYQLDCDEFGYPNQTDFSLIDQALDIADRLHIGRTGQICIAAGSFIFVITELILKILEVI